MTNALPVELDPAVIEQLGQELDEIYDSTIADLGEHDERYIRRLIRTQRSLALGSRIVMLAGAAVRPKGVFGRKTGVAGRRVGATLLGLGTAGPRAGQDPREHGDRPQRHAWPVGLDERS